MKKKILSICLVAVMAVMAIAGASLAYFTAEDTATNVFTVGNVAIDLTEPEWDKKGAVDAPEVYPGEALAKDPTVKNTGKNPCFVRISVTGWDSLKNAKLSAQDITYRTDYVDEKLGENWTLHDGYFYYTKVLAVNETTDALFDQIVIPTDVTNGDAATEYKLDVKAYAVQAQGAKPSWSAVQAMSVEEIAGWFNTCMPQN